MALKPTFYDFSLNDGQVVQVTRKFAGLYMFVSVVFDDFGAAVGFVAEYASS